MSRIDNHSSTNSAVNAQNDANLKSVVDQGAAGDSNNAEDAGQGVKGGKGKGKVKGGDAAKVVASQGRAAQLDSVVPAAAAPSRLATGGREPGGSMDLGAPKPGQSEPSPANLADAGNLANDVAPPAPGDAGTAPIATMGKPDADARVSAAQAQLSKDMADPNVSAETLQKDVQAVVDATNAAGRPDDSLKALADAMPANTSQKGLASVFAMAAKCGVDLDSGAGKIKDAQTNAAASKADRAAAAAAAKALIQAQQEAAAAAAAAQQQQAAQAAQAAQQQSSRASGGGGSGGGSSGISNNGGGGGGTSSGATGSPGASGASSWDGTKATASTATKDTSAAGGEHLSYSGPAENFPNDTSKWASYDDMKAKATSQMAGVNTPEQTSWVFAAIEKEAAATGIDKRFILAVVMQESGGNVNVRTTNNGVNNPGLMQSHNGASFDGSEASVMQMIKDGVQGTKDGDGLIQGVNSSGNLFTAARLYNSGQVDASNLSNGMGATASYCADLANRVMGRM